MSRSTDLTTGPIPKTLTRLTLPMVMGFASGITFNLVDTIFVGRLGTEPLAAISFTFPVVMLIVSLSVGLGLGAGSTISRAIGRGDTDRVRRLTTDSLVLSMAVVIVFVTAGMLTIRPLFTLLGATPDIITLINQYMLIWYPGMLFVIIPMMGNHAIRATGDTLYPGLIMVTGSVTNLILDPILIFGLLGFPRMELAGAALATVIARAITLVMSLYILVYRERMIDFSFPRIAEVVRSWKDILYIGIPAAATNLLFPLSMGVVTYLASRFGPEAVGAVGAGLRVESFAFIVIIALSTAMVPFTGQNWGAERFDRVYDGLNHSNRFTVWWGMGCWIMFVLLARPIASLFSTDPIVIAYIVMYLYIMPAGLSLQGIFQVISATLNAINRPIDAAGLNIIRVFLFYIPLTFLGTLLLGYPGLIGGIALTNNITGLMGLFWTRRTCRRSEAAYLPVSRIWPCPEEGEATP
ncbi:MAG: MATE family efflux transporter [Deltaproteobacteria bacterium]|nr:MATE family efflux transporter [Candidatus Zymogenaceae bacterium]